MEPVITTDVLIVGAGPTGLLLAGDLAAAGVATSVLERRTVESNLTRAFAVHARTLEQLDARGLADELVATGRRIGKLRLFGGVKVELAGLPTRFPYVLITPQYHTERVLEEWAGTLGAQIVRGAQVIQLRQDDDCVDVVVRDSAGAIHTYRASYVVGADGHHSTVREALGLPFPGESVVLSVMLADVRMSDAPPETLTVNGTGDGFVFVVPFGDGWYRVIARDHNQNLPDSAPVDFDELRDITRRVLGTDYGMHSPRWLSRFHSDERQVPRYRVGRALLAGDAAHVHSPAGGQGMNTGLQDAANLGWKLAAVVRGRAGDALLDTYHAERHPVGAQVLRFSGALLRAAMLRPRLARSTRNLVARLALRLPSVQQWAAARVSGLSIAYKAPAGAHHLVGTRAPDLPLRGQTRLYEALRGRRFVLVGPEPDLAACGAAQLTAQGWADRVDIHASAAGCAAVTLVRPDGYVAWAAERPDSAAVRRALTQWCGASGTGGGGGQPAGRRTGGTQASG